MKAISRGTVLAVISGAAAAGTTSLAVNMSIELARLGSRAGPLISRVADEADEEVSRWA